MSQSGRRKLGLRRETLRRLARGELGQVAGGNINRCTYERSGCYGQGETGECFTGACTDCCQSTRCF